MAKVTPRNSGKSAAPGTKDDSAGKKEKVAKVFHPSLKPNDEGKPTAKLAGVPDDFDPKKHKPLRKQDFEGEHIFLRMKADKLEEEAKKLREDADMVEKLGSSADRAKAKKLKAMQEKMEALRKQLEEQGIDVESLLGDDE